MRSILIMAALAVTLVSGLLADCGKCKAKPASTNDTAKAEAAVPAK